MLKPENNEIITSRLHERVAARKKLQWGRQIERRRGRTANLVQPYFLVSATKVYSGRGADILMQSLRLLPTAKG